MAEQEKSSTQQRIDNAVYGTPKIKPDEQRKYLGTFRERVCLTISVAQLRQHDWTAAITKELSRGIGSLVFINGNLPDNEIHPYIRAAAQAGGQFTMKTDPEFKTNDDALAVVVAAKEAVYQAPVSVTKRYPELITNTAKPAQTPTKHSFLHDLFHGKEREN